MIGLRQKATTKLPIFKCGTMPTSQSSATWKGSSVCSFDNSICSVSCQSNVLNSWSTWNRSVVYCVTVLLISYLVFSALEPDADCRYENKDDTMNGTVFHEWKAQIFVTVIRSHCRFWGQSSFLLKMQRQEAKMALTDHRTVTHELTESKCDAGQYDWYC